MKGVDREHNTSSYEILIATTTTDSCNLQFFLSLSNCFLSAGISTWTHNYCVQRRAYRKYVFINNRIPAETELDTNKFTNKIRNFQKRGLSGHHSDRLRLIMFPLDLVCVCGCHTRAEHLQSLSLKKCVFLRDRLISSWAYTVAMDYKTTKQTSAHCTHVHTGRKRFQL